MNLFSNSKKKCKDDEEAINKCVKKSRKNAVLIVGTFAGLFSAIGFLPNIINCFVNKDTSYIKWSTVLIILTAQLLWACYGFLYTDYILATFASLAFMMYIILAICKNFF